MVLTFASCRWTNSPIKEIKALSAPVRFFKLRLQVRILTDAPEIKISVKRISIKSTRGIVCKREMCGKKFIYLCK